MHIATRNSPPAAPILLAALALAGCETFSPAQTCDMSPQDNPPVVYTGGVVHDGVYATSPAPTEDAPQTWPWNGPLLLFDYGQQYTIQHHLGATPHWVQLWVSFSPDGAGGGSTIAPAAGNEAQIEGMDDETIKVANFSCSKYSLLVIAGAAGTNPPPQQ